MDRPTTLIERLKMRFQMVLPAVYDDSLSFYEGLAKITKVVNELVDNNNNLPDFILNVIQGVLAGIVNSIMLNVMYPPEGFISAKGDGITDDTEAIQNLLNYASTTGKTLFFPSGTYVVSELEVNGSISMLGLGNSNIVQQDRAVANLLDIIGDNVSIKGINFDGRYDRQLKLTLDLLRISGKNVRIYDCYFNDSNDLLIVNAQKALYLSDLRFGVSRETSLTLSGSALGVTRDLQFENVPSSKYIRSTMNGVTFNNTIVLTPKLLAIEIMGDNNRVELAVGTGAGMVDDLGENNTVIIYGVEEVEKISGDSVEIVGETKQITADEIKLEGESTIILSGDRIDVQDVNDIAVDVNGNIFVNYLGDLVINEVPYTPGLPKGGTDGQLLVKNGSDDFDVIFKTVDMHGIPAGGTTSQVLVKSSNDDYSVEWADQQGGGGGGVNVVNGLDSTSTTSALSANMGRVLNENKAEKSVVTVLQSQVLTNTSNIGTNTTAISDLEERMDDVESDVQGVNLELAKKGAKVKLYKGVLLATDWVGTAKPFTQEIPLIEYNPLYHAVTGGAECFYENIMVAVGNCGVILTDDDENKAIISALKAKPTVDIPYCLAVFERAV